MADKIHKARKDEFKRWRSRRKLSYGNFVKAVNEEVGFEALEYRTVTTSWGGRGQRPRKSSREAIRKVFPDCPLLV